MELFQDVRFEQGMNLSSVSDSEGCHVTDILRFHNEAAVPCWRLAQWGSRFSLAGEKADIRGNTVEYKNEGKRISRMLKEDGTVSIDMDLYGGKEYTSHRKYGEPWPHILIEQSIAAKPRLSDLDKLELEFGWTVGFCKDLMGENLDKKLHSAQVTAYFTIHNLNQSSSDYGDFMWFGIPVYDSRYLIYPEYFAIDGGKEGATGRLIYTVDGKKIYDDVCVISKEHHVQHDILPLIKEGLERGRDSGFLTKTELGHLHLTSFNLGWEVTGTFDCSFTFTGLSLEATMRK